MKRVVESGEKSTEEGVEKRGEERRVKWMDVKGE